jgi:hypothetical protein
MLLKVRCERAGHTTFPRTVHQAFMNCPPYVYPTMPSLPTCIRGSPEDSSAALGADVLFASSFLSTRAAALLLTISDMFLLVPFQIRVTAFHRLTASRCGSRTSVTVELTNYKFPPRGVRNLRNTILNAQRKPTTRHTADPPAGRPTPWARSPHHPYPATYTHCAQTCAPPLDARRHMPRCPIYLPS